MVKGISRQVILVSSPDKALFDQAIFILKDNAVAEGISDEALVKEAQQAMGSGGRRKRGVVLYSAFWAFCGALITGFAWVLSAIL